MIAPHVVKELLFLCMCVLDRYSLSTATQDWVSELAFERKKRYRNICSHCRVIEIATHVDEYTVLVWQTT